MDEIYKRIEDLCIRAGVNITSMCKEAGVPRSALSDYKAGRIKSLSADKLQKLAAYFGVSVDYLLGNEEKEKPAVPRVDELGFDDFTYALHNEAKELSEENKRKLLDMARIFRAAQLADQEKEKRK